jgi:hypothetical protein
MYTKQPLTHNLYSIYQITMLKELRTKKHVNTAIQSKVFFMTWQWRTNAHAQADTMLSNESNQEDPVLNFRGENDKL